MPYFYCNLCGIPGTPHTHGSHLYFLLQFLCHSRNTTYIGFSYSTITYSSYIFYIFTTIYVVFQEHHSIIALTIYFHCSMCDIPRTPHMQFTYISYFHFNLYSIPGVPHMSSSFQCNLCAIPGTPYVWFTHIIHIFTAICVVFQEHQICSSHIFHIITAIYVVFQEHHIHSSHYLFSLHYVCYSRNTTQIHSSHAYCLHVVLIESCILVMLQEYCMHESYVCMWCSWNSTHSAVKIYSENIAMYVVFLVYVSCMYMVQYENPTYVVFLEQHTNCSKNIKNI